MTKAEKDKLVKLSEEINQLNSSIVNIASITDRTIDTTAELKDAMIGVLNRLNEVELSIESQTKTPLVMPAEVKPVRYKRRYRKKPSTKSYLFRYIKRWMKNNAPA